MAVDAVPSSVQRVNEGDDRPAVVVVDWNVTGGSPVGSSILEFLEDLRHAYRFVVVFAHYEGPAGDIEKVKVRVPPGPSFVTELLWPTLVRRTARRLRARERGSITVATQGQLPGSEIATAHFCHAAYLDRYFAGSGAKGLRRISRFLVHRYSARLEKKAFAGARIVTVPSSGLEGELEEYYPEVRGKIVRIPYPIDIAGFDRPPEFDRRAERVRLGYEDGDVVFCFVGLGDFARKGLAVAIDALALLGEQRRGRILVVGGTAGEIAVYRKLADAGGVGERVRFVGFQSDIRPYLWLSDVFLFPTIYETFSKASYEAAAAGLPVIATRVHGIEDLIEDGVNGWFAERTDSSVAAAMRAAVEAHERLPELGRRARESTLAFDRRFYVEKWDRLLARTLAGSSDTARQDDGLVMTSERPGDEPVLP